jgi:hypothetical protein
LATGVIEGGVITKNDDTLINVSAGKAIIVDFSDADNPVISYLT